MYWKPTPVRGVSEAELPQFTIIGYETNDRKVNLNFQFIRNKLKATGLFKKEYMWVDLKSLTRINS